MTRIPNLETQLAQTLRDLRRMADRVLQGLVVIQKHFEHPNRAELVKLVVWDNEVDRLEERIDDAILHIFATQQPLAFELRLAFATVKIASIIERMGDAVESMARQITARDPINYRKELHAMLSDALSLCRRSYAAMFEQDASLIHEMRQLDDSVDAGQREIFHFARNQLYTKTMPDQVDDALVLINISSRLEKIADLACDWSGQIDFYMHGRSRITQIERRHHIAFLDNSGGLSATIAASTLAQEAKNRIEISVISLSQERTQILTYATELSKCGIKLDIFPIASLESTKWLRTFMAICVGDFCLNAEQKAKVPFKTILEHWPEIKLYNSHSSSLNQEHLESTLDQLKKRIKALIQVTSLA